MKLWIARLPIWLGYAIYLVFTFTFVFPISLVIGMCKEARLVLDDSNLRPRGFRVSRNSALDTYNTYGHN